MPSHPDRVRNLTMKVPACLRLGHAWQFDPLSREAECFRCHIKQGYAGREFRSGMLDSAAGSAHIKHQSHE